MTLLSAHVESAYQDIFAIQEPARYKDKHATFCDPSSPFIPLYPTNHYSKVCFLVNKRLPYHTWEIEHLPPYISILTLYLGNGPITVTNMYNRPIPQGSYSTDSRLLQLPGILARPGAHILAGDMNLYHPLWSNTGEQKVSKIADDLLEITATAGLGLATPKGITT
ncbi:Endonuclease/exonuclease/phosphatase [Aspergillus californicus]